MQVQKHPRMKSRGPPQGGRMDTNVSLKKRYHSTPGLRPRSYKSNQTVFPEHLVFCKEKLEAM